AEPASTMYEVGRSPVLGPSQLSVTRAPLTVDVRLVGLPGAVIATPVERRTTDREPDVGQSAACHAPATVAVMQCQGTTRGASDPPPPTAGTGAASEPGVGLAGPRVPSQFTNHRQLASDSTTPVPFT